MVPGLYRRFSLLLTCTLGNILACHIGYLEGNSLASLFGLSFTRLSEGLATYCSNVLGSYMYVVKLVASLFSAVSILLSVTLQNR